MDNNNTNNNTNTAMNDANEQMQKITKDSLDLSLGLCGVPTGSPMNVAGLMLGGSL